MRRDQAARWRHVCAAVLLARARLVACCIRARLAAPVHRRCCSYMRTRGSLRSGRGGRRGRLAPCRGPLEGARAGGRLAAVGDFRGTDERLAAHPARTDARWASVPGARRPRLPPLTSGADMGRDPEGSCAAAPLRAWLQRRRLRSPAHCVGTRRRRLGLGARDCGVWDLGAEDGWRGASRAGEGASRAGGGRVRQMKTLWAARRGTNCAALRCPLTRHLPAFFRRVPGSRRAVFSTSFP
jgi:hypothetical protein